MRLRSRVELFKGSGIWEDVELTREFRPAETALLLCDVWNDHWCRGAARRVDAMAQRMNDVVSRARERGIQIVHAPSETLDYYANSPHRQRILDAPRVSPPEPVNIVSPPLPIDDSDGGCDSGERPWYKAWSRQHPAIEIRGDDVISDSGPEIYGYLAALDIRTLLYLGVHTNMCVLNRSFGIKQMTRWGVRCILVRDLTDAMYNPERPPHVDHDRGTDLVIQHVEAYWCPSVVSCDVMGDLR